MSTTISFIATLGIADAGAGCGCSESENQVVFGFEGGTKTFDAAVRTLTSYSLNSPSGFTQMPLVDEMETVDFLALSAVQGSTVMLLIGQKASWLGSAGIFPTGFVGGETFEFDLQTYNALTGGFDTDATILVTFTAAAQSASDVARAINSQLALEGYAPLATVASSGQLLIESVEPGQFARVANSTANATIGFASTNLGATGTGNAVVITGNFFAELDSISSDSFWLKGSAYLNLIVAGS